MDRLLRTLASLKLAVILLVVLLAVLATGTIVESRTSGEVARQAVYYSWWFIALQVVFAVNVIASVASLYPWSRARIGFLVTHGGMLVILLGATLSYFFKTEGQLGLWEGDSGQVIENVDIATGAHSTHQLPFRVTLDDFQIDRYQGTMRPAMFRSKVRVTDPATGQTFPADIWMNNPLTYRGYTLFQSSYEQRDGREASVFSVSKDPGQNVAFLGYGLLVVGMCIVFGTRVATYRRMRQAKDAVVGIGKRAAVVALLGALLGGGSASAADTVETLRRLPVQHDGRVMPFDTVAREAVWKVTGRTSWEGEDPVATVARWLAAPDATANSAVIQLPSGDFAAAIGLPGADHISFVQLVNNRRAMQLFGQASAMAQREQRRTGLLAEAEKLEERATALQRFLNRDLVHPVPPPGGDLSARWSAPAPADTATLLALAAGPRLAGWPAPDVIEREITLNKVRPGRIAWIVLLASLAISLAAWRWARHGRALDVAAFVALVAGFGVMTWGIGTRWAVGGRVPASNMYESMLFLAWGVGLFAVVAFVFIRNRLVVVNASAMSALAMLLVDLLPMDGFIHPVPPVLSGTVWLAIHVPIIMVGYSVLALGLFIAHLQIGITAFAPQRAETAGKMYDLLYWYIHVGNILLVTGILTGSIWAASSWGRYWGWDPKEVWSLVAFLAYMAILHAKLERLIGQFGVAAISIVAFQTILMTYLGVNYVLGTGLHSYGFGDSPIVKWMIGIAVVEAAFVGGCWLKARGGGSAAPAEAA